MPLFNKLYETISKLIIYEFWEEKNHFLNKNK